MIQPVLDFVLKFSQSHPDIREVLEVGSLNVSGIGTPRNMFKSSYTGIDLDKGDNVDIVMDAMDIKEKFKPDYFDLILCLETLEHVKNPIALVENMKWALQPGGYLLITTPGIGNPEHNWPSDYYRFFENTYKDVFLKDFEEVETRTVIWNCDAIVSPNTMYPHAILGYGRKPS